MTWTRALLTCALVAAASTARAQPQPQPQPAGPDADAIYEEGRTLMAADKIAEACIAFQRSQKLAPSAPTLFALATCREKLGQLATARRLFLEVEQQTRAASDAEAAQFHKLAVERAAKLEPRVPKLTINVPDRSRRSGLDILRDREIVPVEKWNSPQPVDGGAYTITARAPGVKEWSTRVTLAAEADARTIDVPELQPDMPPPPPPPPPVIAHRRGLGLPIAVSVGAVALLGGALGFSLWGDSTYDQAKAELMDQARRDSLKASADRKRYAAEGLAAAGIGCAGVAVWLFIRQRGGGDEAAQAHASRLMLAPTASGLGVAGRF